MGFNPMLLRQSSEECGLGGDDPAAARGQVETPPGRLWDFCTFPYWPLLREGRVTGFAPGADRSRRRFEAVTLDTPPPASCSDGVAAAPCATNSRQRKMAVSSCQRVCP